MAKKRRAGAGSAPIKRLLVLTVLAIALVGSLIFGTVREPGTKFTPSLALDLEGGTQLILTPVATDNSEITDEDVNQAIEIIRQRVDASGVAEAEITAQGGKNIVVALPGEPSKETLDLVRTSAVLRLRPVLTVMGPDAINNSSLAQMQAQAQAQSSGSQPPKPEDIKPLNLSPEELQAEITKLADSNKDGKLSTEPLTTPKDSSDLAWVTEKVLYDAYTLQCGSEKARLDATADAPDKPFVACAEKGEMKYILGPAEVEGTNLTQASSGPAVDKSGNPTGGWAVHMQFDKEGGEAFAAVTGRLHGLTQPRNQFAIVLDGQVLSAPVPSGPIAGGQAEITGKFTAEEAASLANQLSFGSLPLNFEVQSEEQISATLGTEQLQAGLVAGLIGGLLIVLYMLWQYHALGIVSVASIALSTGMSYLVICFLSWSMGYRLSMAGVLGMIISVGVTADSFIVYFERIRDEIRDGRTIKGAIEHGWARAKRTIIISDCVNLLASIVLYLLTVGSVRGFAFTLGITTVLDLIVVMLFTYPLVTLLGRLQFFNLGKRFSGLDKVQLRKNPLYRGRGAALAGRKQSANTEADSEQNSDAALLEDVAESGPEDTAVANSAAAAPAEETEAEVAEEPAATVPVTVGAEIENSAALSQPGLTLAERRAQERKARKKKAATDGIDSQKEGEN